MKSFIITLLCLLSISLQAQDKSQRIQEIRQRYADAKSAVAHNGKGGNPAKDMQISINAQLSIEHDIWNEEELFFYFDEHRLINSDGSFQSCERPYFIIHKVFVHGHEIYAEYLIDPKSNMLMFSYSKSITDSGMSIEHRAYFDRQGQCIQTRHDNEIDDVTGTGEELKQTVGNYLRIFRAAIGEEIASVNIANGATSQLSKPAQMQHIRTQYAAAKDKIAKNTSTFYPYDVTITIHNQEEGDCPPTTDVIHLYGEKKNQDALSDIHCYFASTNRVLMGFTNYNEYLYDPQSTLPIFAYTRSAEEGNQYEWRFYYDSQGQCIESKTDMEDGNDAVVAHQSAQAYRFLFRLIWSLT